VNLWNVADGKLLQILPHSDIIRSLDFSPDGEILFSGSASLVNAWSTSSAYCVYTKTTGMPYFALSPDGRLIATPGSVGIDIWQAPDWSFVNTFGSASYGPMAFSYSGALLATPSGNLWNVSDGELLFTFPPSSPGSRDTVYALAFSPDDEVLAIGYGDGVVGGYRPEEAIDLWRISDGQFSQSLRAHTDDIYALAFSPDGEILASAGADSTIRLWRVTDGVLLRTIQSGWTVSLSFSPDGTLLASGTNYDVYLWGIE
jgi:WD40 repeat protein